MAKIVPTTDLEKSSLEAHVDLCALRYGQLDERLTGLEEKVEAIGFINHSLLIYFCIEFADYALQNYEKKRLPKTEECISLVRKWIENPNSVSKEEAQSKIQQFLS